MRRTGKNKLMFLFAAMMMIASVTGVVSVADAQITEVQSIAAVANNQNSTSVNASYGVTPTQNNLLVAVCGISEGTTTLSGPSGWSTAILDQPTVTDPGQGIFYKIAGAAEGTAVSCSASANSGMGIKIYEYSGVSTAAPLDAVTSVTGNTTATVTGTVTTTADNTVLIGGVTIDADATFNDTWNNSFTETGDVANTGAAATRNSFGNARRIVTTTGSFSTGSTTTVGGTFRGSIAAFKEPVLSVYTWRLNAVDGNWENEANWDVGDGTPGNDGYPNDFDDKAVIESTSDNISTAGTITIGELELKGTYTGTLTLSGTTEFMISKVGLGDGGLLITTGSLVTGGTLDVDGTLSLSGTLNIDTNDSDVTIGGTVVVDTGGVTVPGTGTVTLNGTTSHSYTDNTSNANFGRVTIAGTINLDTDMNADAITISTGGTLTTDGFDLDVAGTMDIDGVLDASGAGGLNTTINVGGNWDATGGTFTNTNSTVVFDGDSSVTSGGESFYNVTIGSLSTGGTLTTADDLNIDGTLTVGSAGTTIFDISGDTVTMSGAAWNMTNLNSFVTTTSTVILDDETTVTSDGKSFLSVQLGTATVGGTLISADALSIDGTFRALNGNTTVLDISNDTVTMSGTTWDMTNLDTFTTLDSTVIFDGDTNLTSAGRSFESVQIGTLSVGGTIVTQDNMAITGTFRVLGGGTTEFDISNDNVSVAGTMDFTNLTTFTSASSTVIFNGTTNLTSNSKTFVGVQIGTTTTGGTLITQDDLDVNGTLRVLNGGTTEVDLTNDTMTIAGTLDFTNLDTFVEASSTVRFDGISGQSVTSNVETFKVIEVTNTGTLSFIDSFITTDFVDTTADSGLVFDIAGTYTISGSLTLDGLSGMPITLQSSDGATRFGFSVTGSQFVSFLSVNNSEVDAGDIVAQESTNINTDSAEASPHWIFVGTTYTWTGATDGRWEEENNWSTGDGSDGNDGYPSTASHKVVIDSSTQTITTEGTITVGELELSGGFGGTLSIDGTTTFFIDNTGAFDGDLLFTATGTIAHADTVGTAVRRLVMNIDGDLTLGANAQFNAVGRGYDPGEGPGAPSVLGDGGSHGGIGGDDAANGSSDGATYGSITAPDTLGSGSATGGASGGGAFEITVGGATTLNGTMNVTGGVNASGGAGGSIYLTTGSISGSGTLEANGGGGSGEGGGGGGRIAVILTGSGQDFSSFSGTMNAFGGDSGGANEDGAAGSVYMETLAQGTNNGTLIIDNNNLDAFDTAAGGGVTTELTSTGTQVGSVIIRNGAEFEIASPVELTVSGTWTNTAAQTMTGGTVLFSGASTHTLTTTSTLNFFNVDFTGTGTWTINGTLDVDGTMHLQNGTLDLATNDPFTFFGGNFTIENTGTFTTGVNTVTFNGDLTYTDVDELTNIGTLLVDPTTTLSSDLTCNNLTIDAGDTLVTDGYEIDCSGSVTINGTLDASDGTDGTSTIFVGRDWTNNNLFIRGNSTVQFDSSSGQRNITSGTSAYNNVVFNGGATWNLQDNMDIEGTITLTAGTVDVTTNNRQINVAGNWTNNGGIFTEQNGTVVFDGDSTVTSNGENFFHVEIGTVSVGGTLITADDLDVDGTLRVVNTSGTTIFDISNDTAFFAGNVLLANLDSFVTTTSTAVFDGTTTMTGTANTDFVSVQIGTATVGGSLTVTTTLSVDGTLRVLNGNTTTLDITNQFLTTSGTTFDLTNLDTFTSTSSTVRFDGTVEQTATSIGLTYENIEVTNTGTVNFADQWTTSDFVDVTAGSDLIFNPAGTYTVSGTLTLNGQDTGTRIFLNSASPPARFNFSVSGSQNVSFLDVNNSEVDSGDIVATFSLDNNTDSGEASPHWIFDNTSTFTWTGASDAATWEDQGNWNSGDGSPGNDGYPNDADHKARINSTSHNISTAGTITVGELEISGTYTGTLTLSGTTTFIIDNTSFAFDGDLIFTAAGTLTHTDNTTVAAGEKVLTMNIDGDMTLGAGAKISGDARGFDANEGTGAPSEFGEGGGYGGIGGDQGENGPTTTVYGSMFAPTDVGSGGDNNSAGGGVILTVTGTSTINGTISVNGQAGSDGSGSGGSIFLTTGSITGAGTLQANGGDTTNDRGTGAGGRIAVVLTATGADFSAFTGTMTAFGGEISGTDITDRGAAGTVYQETEAAVSGQGTLIIDNNNQFVEMGGVYTLMPGAVNLNNLGEIIIRNDGNLAVDSNDILDFASVNLTTFGGGNSYITIVDETGVSFPDPFTLNNYTLNADGLTSVTGDWTITGNGILSHSPNNLSQLYRISLTINGDLTIDTTGQINTDELGYSPDTGPGAPSGNGEGGAHGGIGGDQGQNGATSLTYGSITAPVTIGSGGGRIAGVANNRGGGAVALTVTGTTTVNGTITVQGEAGINGSGAGGAVYLTTDNILGSGTLLADGGDSTNNRGGGGGGRIAVILTDTGADFSSFTGTMTAYGGFSGDATDVGAAGTVYQQSQSQGSTNGILIIDNNNLGLISDVTTLIHTSVTGTNVGDVLIRNDGNLEMRDSSVILNVSGTWTNTTTGSMTLTAGTVIFDSTSAAQITSNGTFFNVEFNGVGGVWTLADPLDVNGTLKLSNGTLDVSTNNYPINLAGNWLNVSGTFTPRNGTVVFDGTSIVTSNGYSFYNIDLGTASSGGSLTATTTLSIDGTFRVLNGNTTTLDITNQFLITSGTSFDLTNLDIFTATNSTFLLNGTMTQALTSDTKSFNHLIIDDGLVGYWRLDETASPVVDSSRYGNDGTWNGTPVASTSTSGTFVFTNPRSLEFNDSADYVDIPDPGTDSVFDFETGESITLSVWINHDDPFPADFVTFFQKKDNPSGAPNYGLELASAGATSSTREFSFFYRNSTDTGWNIYETDSPVVTAGTWQHFAVTYTFGTASSAKIYLNGVEQSGTWISGTGNEAPSVNNEGFTVGRNSSTDLQEFDGKIDDIRIYNRTLSSTEIQALADGTQPDDSANSVNLQDALDVNGTLSMYAGRLNANSQAITAAGSWRNVGGAFNATTTTVTFDGTADDGNTLLSGGEAFNHVDFSDSGDTWTLDDDMDVDGNLTITAGDLDAGGASNNYTITLAGNWNNSDIFTSRSGTVTFDGTSLQTITSDTDAFYNAAFNGTGATFRPVDAMDVDGTFLVQTGSFDLDTNDPTLDVGGNFTVTSGGTFTAGANTVTFDGTGARNITTTAGTLGFFNIDFNGLGGSWTVTGTLDVNGTFVVNNGTLDLATNDPLTFFGGNFTIQTTGTFTTGANTVTFDGDLTYTDVDELTNIGTLLVDPTTTLSSDMTCTNLTIDAGDTLVTDGYEIDCSGSVTIDGTLDASPGTDGSTTINVGRNWTNNNLFIHTSSTVVFDSTGGVRNVTSGASGFENVTFNGGATWNLNDAMDVDGTLDLTAGTLDVTASNFQINVARDWDNNGGTFTPQSGTVVFDGSVEQFVTAGASNFANLEVTNSGTMNFQDDWSAVDFTDETANSTLVFNPAGTYTVSGSLNLNGQAVATRITLNSSSPPTRFNFSVTGSQFVSFLDVNNSEVDAGDIVATESFDNNTDKDEASPHWIIFAPQNTYTWTGNGDGTTWELQTNWDIGDGTPGGDGYPDDNTDNAVIDSTADNISTAGTITVASLDISGTYTGTLTIDGTTTFIIDDAGNGTGDLNFTAAGTITHTDNTTVAAGEKVLTMTIDGSMTVGSGARISADARGFDALEGSGAPTAATFDGATHGGIGGDNNRDNTILLSTYGSLTAPINVGSGGDTQSGGGAIILTVGETSTVNGTISANVTFGNGAGAGGSIYLTTQTLVGSGTLSANGGSVPANVGGGGGGRVAVILTGAGNDFSSFTGTLQAFGGTANVSLESGAAGTIYQEIQSQASGTGTLTIDNNGVETTGGVNTLMASAVNLSNFDAVIIRNYGNLAVDSDDTLNFTTANIVGESRDEAFVTITEPSGVSFPDPFTISGYTLNTDALTSATGDWTVSATGALSHSRNGADETYKIDMTLTGDLTVDAGGLIDVTAMGYMENQGPGASPGGGDGASHGGIGGDNNSSNSQTSFTYGSITAPVNLGSGGEQNYGGGAVALRITGLTTVNGSIVADGITGPNAGGAGGSVYITTATIAGSGDIRARGAIPAANTGGGGGGRVAVLLSGGGADFSSFTGTMDAFGGNSPEAGSDGAAGTVYMQSQEQGSTNGTLIIDNNGFDVFDTASGGSVTTSVNGTVSGTNVGAVTIRNSAELDLEGTLTTFTVSGTWLNQAAQTHTAGTVVFDRTGPQAVTTNSGTFFNVEVTNTGTLAFIDATEFNNFTDETASSGLQFNAGSTYTIGGTLVLDGQDSGTRIILDSSDGATRFAFSVTGSQFTSFLSINNSEVNTGDIVATGSVGNNTDADEASPHWIITSAENLYIWTGGFDQTTWEDQGNWDIGDGSPGNDGYPDDNTDKALINSTADPITTAGTITVGELELSGTYTGTLTIDGTTTFIIDDAAGASGDLNFTAAGTITHTDNTTVAAGQKDLTITIDGDFTLGANAHINVDTLGFDAGEGPGASGGTNGAAYGGLGGANVPTVSESTYGSITAPVDVGSGASTSGGGAVNITVVGTSTVNGTISANGEDVLSGGGESGSGGSIFLTTGRLTGSGTMQANGGDTPSEGAGGGGRVAVILTTTGADFSSWTGTLQAYGGTEPSVQLEDGAAGTVYMEPEAVATGAGTLIIDNNNTQVWNTRHNTLMPSSVDLNTFGEIIIRNQGILGIDSDDTIDFTTVNLTVSGTQESFLVIQDQSLVTFGATYTVAGYSLVADGVTNVTSDWVISSTGRLTHSRNQAAETWRIVLTIDGDLTVNSGGLIDADTFGYAAEAGPGGVATFGDGAGYGGHGGDNGADGGFGDVYGSITDPVNIGSGGDSGRGGGALIFTVTGTTTVDGTIRAKGEENCSGCGSGGSINITTGFITGSANIDAGGGNAVINRGGGGGGRVAVTLTGTDATFASYTGTMIAYGGNSTDLAADEEAAAGTVYMQTPAQGSTNGTLIINNVSGRQTAPGVTTEIALNVTGTNVGDVSIVNAGILDISEAGVVLNVSGTWINSATQTMTAGTVIFDGSQTQSITTNSGTFFNVEVTNTGTLTFNDATSFENFTDETASSNLVFNPAGTYTITNTLTLNGQDTLTRIVLQSSSPPARFNFSVTGSQNVSFLDVNNSEVDSGDIVASFSLDNNTDSGEVSPHWIFVDAVTYTWTGASDAVTWEDQGNWDIGDASPGNDGYPDDSNDKALIDSTAHSITTAGTITVGELEISGTYTGTLTIDGTTTFIVDNAGEFDGDVIFTAAGTITHPDNSTSETHTLTMDIDGDLMLGASATISTDTRGFDADNGPGAATQVREGGAYGGVGGVEDQATATTVTYGSIRAPVNIGSGGDDSSGGGAVQLTVGGTSTLSGTISTNGQDSTLGSGAGGSIYLTTGFVTGAGTLEANGGNSSLSRGAGGGGRVSVILTGSGADFSSFTGTMTAYGGDASSAQPDHDGAAGTVYRQTQAQGAAGGDLFIRNFVGADASVATGVTTLISTSVTDTEVGNVTIVSGAAFEMADSAVELSVAGDWTNSGTQVMTGGTVAFISTSSQTITSNGTFFNVDFNGADGTWTLTDTLDVDGTFNLQNGTLDIATNDPTTFFAGNFTIQTTGTFTVGTSTVTFNGNLTYTDVDELSNIGTLLVDPTTTLSSDMTCTNLTIDAGDTLVTDGYEIDCSGSITIDGTLDASPGTDGSSTINVGRNWTNNNLFIHTSSTVVLDSTGGARNVTSGASGFENVTFNGGATWDLQDAMDVDGTITLTSGTVDVTTNNWVITVARDWVNNGGVFTPQSGTVTFDGSVEQNITAGASNFTNLETTNTGTLNSLDDYTAVTFTDEVAGSTLIFNAGSTYTISGTLTLTGTSGNEIILDSSDSSTRFTFDITSPSGTQTVSGLNVSNSQASSADIVANNSLRGDNTDAFEASPHWIFPDFLNVYTWTGVSDASTWEEEGNWDVGDGTPGNDGYPDDNRDKALIDSTAHSISTAGTITVAELEIIGTYTGTLTLDGTTTFVIDDADGCAGCSGDLIFTATGTITHTDNTTVAAGQKDLTMTIDGDFTLGVNAVISASERGYDSGEGPGTATGLEEGGSYGGIGGDNQRNGTDGTTYGSITAPTDVGSGGADSGSGGGAVTLTVVGTSSINGTIITDGEGAIVGGGSGGSIYLTTGNITGSGTLIARGGGVHNFGGSFNRGAGGGGRIAVVLTAAGADFTNFTGTMNAFGGDSTEDYEDGAAGTVYMETQAQASGTGTLIVRNFAGSETMGGVTTLMPTNVNVNAFNEIVIQNNGNLSVDSGDTLNFTTINITGSGAGSAFVTIVDASAATFPDPFTLSGYTLNVDGLSSVTGDWTIADTGALSHSRNGTTETYRMNLTISGDLTIDAGGSIDVDDQGYAFGFGPGSPSGVENGGSYGGKGGDNQLDGHDGLTYGSITAPVNIGSGASASSDGGGAIVLTITGTTTINGTISANGEAALLSGGSGGSVFLTTGFIAGSEDILANGGDNSAARAAGGGGRIAVILTGASADFSNYTGTINAFGGDSDAANEDGAAGTVYMQSTAQGSTNGTLIIDNNNLDAYLSADGGNITTSVNGTVTGTDVGAVIIRNSAELQLHGTFQSLTVSGTWLNQATQTHTVGTVIFDGGQAQSITTSTGTFFNVEVTNADSAGVSFEDETSFNNFTDETAGSVLTFNAGSTYTISGSLVMNGQAEGTRIVLDSSDGSTRFSFVVSAGPQSVSYVDVSNSQVEGTPGNDITASFSFDRANTDSGEASPHWIFIQAGPLRGAIMVVD